MGGLAPHASKRGRGDKRRGRRACRLSSGAAVLWREPEAWARPHGQELNATTFVLTDAGVLETRQVKLAMSAAPAAQATRLRTRRDAGEEADQTNRRASSSKPPRTHTRQFPAFPPGMMIRPLAYDLPCRFR